LRRLELLATRGTSAHFTLIGPWKLLRNRYSPTADACADLREIHSWLKGDESYTFVEINPDVNLTIDSIIKLIQPSATPHYIFFEGTSKIDLKHLVDFQISQRHGLLGVVDKQDNRAFVIFAPALSRALSSGGDVYENISEQWGINWMTDEKFLQLNSGRKSRIRRFNRFIKREGKKVNSPLQLVIFLQKIAKLVLRKVLRNG